MKRTNFPDRLNKRKEEVTARQAKYDALNDAQRLAKLVKRGQGHCKQAACLRRALEKS